MPKAPRVKITKDGPYLVSGNLPLTKESADVGKSGEPEEWKMGIPYPNQETYLLCRCGRSNNKPYCDQSHLKAKFDGTETASRQKYLEQAEKISGPGLDLTDVPALCSSARFCHLDGGTWKNVDESSDPMAKKSAIRSACHCPAGRLVAWDKKTGLPLEPDFKPSISVTEDPQKQVSGPLWLKGGVVLEGADGKEYEKRNRVALCRCGRSKNKPFCDGAHIRGRFNDGDASLK